MGKRNHSRIRPKAKARKGIGTTGSTAAPRPANGLGTAPRTTQSRRRPPRVLLVDDDATFLDVISIPFRRAGFDIQRATDGAMAMETVEILPPDLIVTDLQMPAIDGTELARRVGALLGSGAPPVVLVTASGPLPASLPGVARVLTKPLSLSELMSVVDELLGERRATATGRHR